jgi:hypothetical protein
VTEMRPDPDSDQAGAESEYGDDTGFAAEATRTSSPDDAQSVESNAPDETAGLTTEDDNSADPGTGAD